MFFSSAPSHILPKRRSVALPLHRWASQARILVLLVGVLTAGTRLFSAGPRPDEEAAPSEVRTGVDTAIVLNIGTARISHYAIRKNLSLFYNAASANRSVPSEESSARWLDLYLARQVIIAEALAEGYAEREDVIRIVDTMERHMLSQSGESAPPMSDGELRTAYEKLATPPGVAKPAFEQLRPKIEQMLVQQWRQTALRSQREAALKAAQINFSSETVERIVRQIGVASPSKVEIPESVTASFAEDTLATYVSDGKTVVVTAEAWRTRFNRLFVRSLPTSAVQLEDSVRDLVAADYACDEARKRGRDREPRFVEDRRNFLYYQALDRFEKERLLPRINVPREELETYYRANPEHYNLPAKALGITIRFADNASAEAWIRKGRPSVTGSEERTVVSRQTPLPGAEAATSLILRLEHGGIFGPVPVPGGALVFLKQATENKIIPFSEAEESIRTALSRKKLDELELKLAREWAPRFVIEDRLDPECFGISGPVSKPWVR